MSIQEESFCFCFYLWCSDCVSAAVTIAQAASTSASLDLLIILTTAI
jgi:hypothetical protein